MKILIFGATGQVGQQLVAQSLSQNYDVTAFTRNPDHPSLSHSPLKIAHGDALESSSVEEAMQGQDAVLCALGMPLRAKGGQREIGTKNIVRAMGAQSVKRLVCLSALGVGDSYSVLPFSYKYLLIPLFMKRLYKDHANQEMVVAQSELDWVIVRPSGFSKGHKRGGYKHGFVGADKSLNYKVAPADVAEFMIAQIASDTYLRTQASISC